MRERSDLFGWVVVFFRSSISAVKFVCACAKRSSVQPQFFIKHLLKRSISKKCACNTSGHKPGMKRHSTNKQRQSHQTTIFSNKVTVLNTVSVFRSANCSAPDLAAAADCLFAAIFKSQVFVQLHGFFLLSVFCSCCIVDAPSHDVQLARCSCASHPVIKLHS